MKFHLVIISIILSILSGMAADTPEFYVGKYGFSVTSASKQEVELTVCNSVGEQELIPETISYDGKEYTITSIGVYAFYMERRTNPLQRVVIPQTVKKIGVGAFDICNKLTEVFLLPSTPPTVYTGNSNYMFRPDAEIYVPSKAVYEKENKGRDKFVELLTFNTDEYVYSGKCQELSPYHTNGSNYEASAGENILLEKQAGHYETALPAKLKLNNDEWQFSVPYSYQISKKPLLVKVEDSYKEYGDPLPEFLIKFDGFVEGEDEGIIISSPSVTTNASQSSDVGDYELTPTAVSLDNYDCQLISGTLHITKAPLSGKVDDLTVPYGTTKYDFTISFAGLKLGQKTPAWIKKPELQTSANAMSPIGDYEISASDYEAKNYVLSSIDKGTLTIEPAKLRLVIDSFSRLYYENNPEFTYKCYGFQNGENVSVFENTPTLSSEASIESNCGQFSITATPVIAPNYDIEVIAGELKILPRTLTLSLDNYSRPYGTDNPDFTILYSGFINNEGVSNIASLPHVYTDADKKSDVGQYTLITSGGEAINYIFRHAQSVLSIVKTDQTIEWNQDLSRLGLGDQVELKAWATSGLEIDYTIVNGDGVELYTVGDKTFMDCQKFGDGLIRAQQQGNNNYHASTRLTNKFHISEEAGIEEIKDKTDYFDIEVANGTIVIHNLPYDTKVSVYNLHGELVHYSTDTTISLPRGLYILKIGRKTIKLSV